MAEMAKQKKIMISLEDDAHRKLKAKTAMEGMSISKKVIALIMEYVTAKKK